MNNKITLYELLGKIKDGQAPKRVKLDDEIYEYKDVCIDYIQSKIKNSNYWLFKDYLFGSNGNRLNDEVEILDNEDEEKKIPEKIPLNYADDRKPEEVYEYLRCSYNQLIDYLKNKGDE